VIRKTVPEDAEGGARTALAAIDRTVGEVRGEGWTRGREGEPAGSSAAAGTPRRAVARKEEEGGGRVGTVEVAEEVEEQGAGLWLHDKIAHHTQIHNITYEEKETEKGIRRENINVGEKPPL
jgi:hypothetical protein